MRLNIFIRSKMMELAEACQTILELRYSARLKIHLLMKRILRKFGYPQDLQEADTHLVLEQADLLWHSRLTKVYPIVKTAKRCFYQWMDLLS